jgi:carbonic anhydrase
MFAMQMSGARYQYVQTATIPVGRSDLAELHQADSLCISCSDFRVTNRIASFMGTEHEYNYDQLILPGASGGVNMNPSWQHCSISQIGLLLDIHGVKDIYVLDHNFCGVYIAEYGAENYAENWKLFHAQNLVACKKLLNGHFPEVNVWLYLLLIDGEVLELVQQ